jgi:GAF domain-containing protein
VLLSPAQNPDVIAGFYEAASHADGWGGAWSALCTAFSADTGLLYRQSRPASRPQILAVRNWPEASHNVAIDRYLQADPDPSHAGTTEAPYHVLSSTVLLDGTAMIGLGLHRKPEAPRFTEEDRAALDGVGRHVAVALRLEALLAAERQASAIRGSALDLAPYGVLIANGRGEILFANRAAEEIAAAGGISLGHGRSCIGHMNPHEAEKLEALPALRAAMACPCLQPSSSRCLSARLRNRAFRLAIRRLPTSRWS